MVDYRTRAPGVYLEEVFPPPAPSLLTGVPAFLGHAAMGPVDVPRPLTLWPQFEAEFGPPLDGGFLAHAVRGFFENDGLICYVVRLAGEAISVGGLRQGLATLADLDAVDLVCAPDICAPDLAGAPSGSAAPNLDAVTALQGEVLADCQRTGGRFAILDGVPTGDPATVSRQRAALVSKNGALYHPWIWVTRPGGPPLHVPPCGHVAGAYSRSDQRVGVHKAPANEPIAGALDLWTNLTDDAVGALYAAGINCLQARPGRGVRIWGAGTLSGDPAWRHVNARRLLLTVGRWVRRFLAERAHEPNDVRLWVRIMRELTGYLDGLFERGALQGATPAAAFFVKCDSETNPPDVVAAGAVVTQVGLA